MHEVVKRTNKKLGYSPMAEGSYQAAVKESSGQRFVMRHTHTHTNKHIDT